MIPQTPLNAVIDRHRRRDQHQRVICRQRITVIERIGGCDVPRATLNGPNRNVMPSAGR